MAYLIEQTETFAEWHAGLRDLRARIAVARRIERAAAGNLGDAKSAGGGVCGSMSAPAIACISPDAAAWW